MAVAPSTLILRHRKENLKKCSLRGLEARADFHFMTYPLLNFQTPLPSLNSYLTLALDAPLLSAADASYGLFILDATWKHADKMLKFVKEVSTEKLILRRIPSQFVTAYPRRQEDCPEPTQGLASIEAIYISYVILGRDPKDLLTHYHWREAFLAKNKVALDFYN